MTSRFLATATKTAAKTDVVLPWTRGTARKTMIARRKALRLLRKSA